MTETVSSHGRDSGSAKRAGRARARRPEGRGPHHRADLHHGRGAPVRRGDLGAARRRPAELADGTTVFEQRGVEFPDFWSVNASTIVTSKYFRGAVGTDAREWSLRQLIDRVVKTYRKAGEEYGYFATPADAEIFEHELAWMLAPPGVLASTPRSGSTSARRPPSRSARASHTTPWSAHRRASCPSAGWSRPTQSVRRSTTHTGSPASWRRRPMA